MKILLVAYSRTGTTRSIAGQIARACSGTMREIKDVHGRNGPIGYLRSAYDAIKGSTPAIEPLEVDPAAYDLVVLGAPVWAGHVAAPMRTFLTQNKDRLRNVALFCTMDRRGGERMLREMAQIVGRIPIATLALSDDEIRSNVSAQKLHRFSIALRALDGVETAAVPRQKVAQPKTFAVTRI